MALNGTRRLIHHTQPREMQKRPSLGARLELICRAFRGGGGGWLQTEIVCCPRAALHSSIAALLFPLPPPLTVQTGAMVETKAQPSNQVMESIKSITQTSERNHIFVRLRRRTAGRLTSLFVRTRPRSDKDSHPAQ